MPAYLTWPEGDGQWPPAVVLGELFGLTDVQREAAERVAGMGSVAIAPHLLHRRAPGGPLPEDDDGRQRGLALISQLTRLELVSDVRDALDAAREPTRADRHAAPVAVGMSFGGHVAIAPAFSVEELSRPRAHLPGRDYLLSLGRWLRRRRSAFGSAPTGSTPSRRICSGRPIGRGASPPRSTSTRRSSAARPNSSRPSWKRRRSTPGVSTSRLSSARRTPSLVVVRRSKPSPGVLVVYEHTF